MQVKLPKKIRRSGHIEQSAECPAALSFTVLKVHRCANKQLLYVPGFFLSLHI